MHNTTKTTSYKYTRSICLLSAAVLLVFVFPGCSSPPSPDTEVSTAQLTPSAAYTEFSPGRLIQNYGKMREDSIVSWSWEKPGFQLHACRSIKPYPVENFSGISNVWTESKLEQALEEISAQAVGGSSGSIDAGIRVAIVEMLPKLTIYKKFFSSATEVPYIQIELVLFEKHENTPLLAVCHFGKDEDYTAAVKKMIRDLKKYFGITA